VAAAMAAGKQTPATVSEQASLAHDLRDCEETEHISSSLDKESERCVLVSYLGIRLDGILDCQFR
jgi:hypothetical protein